MTEQNLGSRIKARRKEMKLTLRELASRCGLTASFLCDLEGNKRGVGADSLLAIGQALGLPLDQLMKDNGQQTAGVDVQLPGGLMRFALEADIPFRQAMCLYWLQRTIQDHRPNHERANLDSVDWLRFYEAVKEWL